MESKITFHFQNRMWKNINFKNEREIVERSMMSSNGGSIPQVISRKQKYEKNVLLLTEKPMESELTFHFLNRM